jgi:metal-responsive CopG/Arc/MetJ family transcriptional regulator
MKEDVTKISITLSNDLIEKIDKNNYNRNKLIVSLLEKYIKEKQK